MGKILLLILILTLYAILTGIIYAVNKKLGALEGVNEIFAVFFPIGIPVLVFGFIAYCSYKLIYKLFKWE